MAALPYMQLYVAEYLADTAHLTATQHGAYLLLIFNYWQRGKPLNNTNERLANVARMSIDEWQKTKPILEEFFEIDGDEWVHARIERDLFAVNEKSGKASEAGKASAARRAVKKATNVERTLNHTDTDTDTDTDTEEKKKHAPTYPDGLNLAAWERWIEYRKAIRKPLKQVSILAAQEALAAFGTDQAAVVKQSIEMGWQGLFELKTKGVTHESYQRVDNSAPARVKRENERRERARQAEGRTIDGEAHRDLVGTNGENVWTQVD